MKIEDCIKFDKFTKDDLIEYYNSGLTIKEVAKKFGVDDETIRRRNKFYGINIREYKPVGKVDKLTKEELVNLYKSGMSMNKVSEMYKTTTFTIKNKNEEFGINIEDYYEFRLSYDIHVFDSIDTEEKAYWLGFLYADGCVRSDMNVVCLKLNAKDTDHLIKFKNFFKDTRSNTEAIHTQSRVTPQGNPQVISDYEVCNPHIKQALINLGCVPAKSLILKFPDIAIFKDPDLVYDFIRGYIDGDGCLSVNYGRLNVSARGTFEFLSGIIKYFPEFNKVYSEVDRRTNSTQYKISCSSNKADLVAHKLYGNATVYLDRKYNKYATLCKLYTGEKSGNIGEGCDANTEITSEITKGPEES